MVQRVLAEIKEMFDNVAKLTKKYGVLFLDTKGDAAEAYPSTGTDLMMGPGTEPWPGFLSQGEIRPSWGTKSAAVTKAKTGICRLNSRQSGKNSVVNDTVSYCQDNCLCPLSIPLVFLDSQGHYVRQCHLLPGFGMREFPYGTPTARFMLRPSKSLSLRLQKYAKVTSL